MNIGVFGYTDKRPVIYALLKLLQKTGDVALISNHRHYKRLLENGESPGHLANVLIAISDASPDEVFEEISYAESDFDHIVFDLQDSLPERLDVMIYVKSYPPSEEEQMFLDIVDDYHTVKLTYDGKREKGAIHLAPLSPLWKTVEQIESYRILAPLPSKELNTGLAKLLAPYLSLKPKAAMSLLTARWKA